MRDLFYRQDRVTPLFETVLDARKKEDSDALQRRIANWQRDFRQVFCETPAGRRVLWYLMHEAYIFRKFGQHNASAYALEGKRELGQDIMDLIGAENVLRSLLAVKAETGAMKEVTDG